MLQRLACIYICIITLIPVAYAVQSAEALLASKMKTALLQAKNKITGEGVCWHAAYKGGAFVKGYHETKDVAYLKAGITYFDALIDQMFTSPDGYKGWVGSVRIGKDGPKFADCHVGDAILCALFLELAEVVLTNPELKKQFGDSAQSYVELVDKHLCEKWIARGTWWQNGPYGGYFTFSKFMTKHNMKEFQEGYHDIGYQFNKNLDMGLCHLRLYRITGDKDHRERARLIFNHSKSRLNLYDDHYVWNYWEPFYPRDLRQHGELGLWVATHPYRNYQAGEVHCFVEAFHSGLTFDETDIKRLVQTNIHMWNGDLEKPRWRNSNHVAVVAATNKGKDFVPSKAYPTKAGCLWGYLCEFSPKLAEIGKKTANNTEIKRKYANLPVTVLDVPFSSCANINMAIAMPAAIPLGGYQQLVSKFRAPGQVTISLCDNTGTVIKQIFQGEHPGGNDGREGIKITSWVADVAAGVYRIRWQYENEYRDYTIWIGQIE